MQDNQGQPLTAQSTETMAGFNDVVTQFFEYRLSAMPTLKAVLEAEPAFYMGQVMRGYMLSLMNSSKMAGAIQGAAAKAEARASGVTAREAMHLPVLKAIAVGDSLAAIAALEALLAAYPHDLIALRIHHGTSFWMGRSQQLMAQPSAVLPAWGADMMGYGNVLGMLAFGMEEMGHYAKAETYGRKAVEVNPDDLWAVHSVAHILEMQRRNDEGLAWLDYSFDAFDDRNPFRGHLWWHRGLYLLEGSRLEEALALYDAVIYDRQSAFYLDLQNAAAFLIRLEFLGMDVGDRWEVLADAAVDAEGDHELAFTDLHNVLALARAGRVEAAQGFLTAMRAYARDGTGWSAETQARIGVPMAEAALAFATGDFDSAAAKIARYKPTLIDIGASHAQRDVVSLIEIEAARRGGQQAVLKHLTEQRQFMISLARMDAV